VFNVGGCAQVDVLVFTEEIQKCVNLWPTVICEPNPVFMRLHNIEGHFWHMSRSQMQSCHRRWYLAVKPFDFGMGGGDRSQVTDVTGGLDW
jgi:hypothetical protein